MELLASKRFVPPARPGLVARPRLIDRLNALDERIGALAEGEVLDVLLERAQ